ncbi:hypothetical protein BGZ65_011627, partial [Modicella reniformis]
AKSTANILTPLLIYVFVAVLFSPPPSLAEVSVSEIVAYANRLSNYSSAPPNFNPQDPNQPFEPPYPREVNMRAGILNQQHIPAAALVSLDGGTMPGTSGQPAPQAALTAALDQQQGAGLGIPPVAATQVPAPVPPGASVPFGVGFGTTETTVGTATNHIQRLANGGHILPQELLDDDDDDSGSSSEEEEFSLYGRTQHEEEQRRQQQQQQQQQQGQQQGQQGQQPDDEDAGDIFDLDLN